MKEARKALETSSLGRKPRFRLSQLIQSVLMTRTTTDVREMSTVLRGEKGGWQEERRGKKEDMEGWEEGKEGQKKGVKDTGSRDEQKGRGKVGWQGKKRQEEDSMEGKTREDRGREGGGKRGRDRGKERKKREGCKEG